MIKWKRIRRLVFSIPVWARETWRVRKHFTQAEEFSSDGKTKYVRENGYWKANKVE